MANAVRHTNSGQTVRLIGSRARDGHVRVEVVDGCGGIPEESLDRVFDVGWRGDASRSTDDGAGLGLAITRRRRISRRAYRSAQRDRWLPVRSRAAGTWSAGRPGVMLLLTGGAGFIGTIVQRRLIKEGARARVFDIAQDRRDDVRDLDRVRGAIQGCDVLVHLAAKVGLGVDVSDLDDYARHNDLGTAVVLRAAAEGRSTPHRVRVFDGRLRRRAPTGARATARPTRPTTSGRPGRGSLRSWLSGLRVIPRPDADHGVRRSRSSQRLRSDQAARRTPGIGLESGDRRSGRRATLPQRLRTGMRRHTPYAGVAALFLSQLADGKPCVVFEDGAQQRDFVHVDDVAAAVVAATTVRLGDGLTPLNIGSGRTTTIGQLAAALTTAIGGPEPVITGRYRLGDVRHITADSRQAQHVLGWCPRVSLSEGVATLRVRD